MGIFHENRSAESDPPPGIYRPETRAHDLSRDLAMRITGPAAHRFIAGRYQTLNSDREISKRNYVHSNVSAVLLLLLLLLLFCVINERRAGDSYGRGWRGEADAGNK